MIERYLEMPYWLIDILPKRVPEKDRGQYFSIEEYFLEHPQIDAVYRHFSYVLLKLNCYEDLDFSSDGEEWVTNPAPGDIEAMVQQCLSAKSILYVLLKSADALITLSGDDTYMTVYHPSDDIIDLLRSLAVSEGLFVWK